MIEKTLGLGLLAVALTLGVNESARAADPYPSKSIRVIVPVPPGGTTDVTTRLVVRLMSEKLGQPMIVENKPGGDSAIGTRYVMNEPADGYTILADSNAFALYPSLKHNPGYEPTKDFTPIGPMLRAPLVLVISGDQADLSLKDLITRAKSSQLSFASSATSVRLPTEMFLQAAGVSMLHVPYKGSATAYPDLAAGRVSMMLTGYPGLDGFLKSGRMRALGVTSAKRIGPLPDVPTLVEQGVNFTTNYWIGIMVRAGTPRDVLVKLSDALRYALSDKELIARITADGGDPSFMSSEAFGELIAKDMNDALKISGDLKLPKD